MVDPMEQDRDTTHPQGRHGGPGAPGWDVMVARAIRTAQVFVPESGPASRVGPSEVSAARWELALGAHGAARLLAALWVEAIARGLPVPAAVDAAVGALAAWSKELADLP